MSDNNGKLGIRVLIGVLAIGVFFKTIELKIASEFESNSNKRGLHAREKAEFKSDTQVERDEAIKRLMKNHPELFPECKKFIDEPEEETTVEEE